MTCRMCLFLYVFIMVAASPVFAEGNRSIPDTFGDKIAAKSHRQRFRDGELIVKFKKNVSEQAEQDAVVRVHKKHGSVTKRGYRNLRMQHVKLRKGMTVEQGIAAYMADPEVEYVQPNYSYRLNAIPNDPGYGRLWNMAKIQAPQAWDLSTGSGSLVVGTIDTGIDYNHPDLLANLWRNESERNGSASVDDDGNGYTDDVYGWNTLTDSGDPMDDQSHGTHVAGTIGATGNNGVGAAGVNWNVKIMACKAFDNTGNGLSSDIIECLQYFKVMKDRGVPLVATNNSYSGDPYDQAMIDAINLMPDVLFIAAASNDSNDNDIFPYYPAGYKLPNVIAVAATDADDQLANFSNFGRYSVHVAAPGVNIESTISQYPDILPENAYSTMSGTSMAAPHVAGLAALIKAHDPSRDWKTIRNLILSGAEPVASVADVTITGGRINARNSLDCSNRTVTALLDYPRTISAGVPATVSVLNIRCGSPAGPVSLTVEGIGTVALLDDGAGSDLAAGDGIYTGTWTPPDAGTRVVSVTAAGFNTTFEVPTLRIESAAVVSPAQSMNATTFLAPTGVPYSQSFSVLGGRAPLVWSATTTLPPGLSISPVSGNIAGTPTASGNYSVSVQVKDALNYTATFTCNLTLATGIKNGWPKLTEPRTSLDIFSQFSFPPVLADLDGNGSDEIIVAARKTDSDNSALYLLDSSGVRASRSDFLNSLSTPAVADLNGDGTPEIIVAEQSRTDGTNPALMIHVLDSRTLADVPWFTPGSYSINNYQFKTVTVEDLDGNGTPEIIAMGRGYALPFDDPEYDRNALFVLNADGSLASGWPKVFDTDTGNDRGVVTGDLYGTGTRQIVVVDNGGMVRIYSKDGTELQAWGYNPKAQGTSEFPVNPTLADLDGDGKPELIIAYAEYDTPGIQRIAAFRPDGTLLPGWPRGFPGKVAKSFSAADLFNEGKAVVILPFASTERGSELLVLRADGSYAPGWPVSLGNAIFNNYHEPVVADLNGDGLNEVLVNVQRPACSGPVDECFTFNAFVEAVGADGLPVAGFPRPIPANAELWSPPAIGDIDGDGLADLLVKSEDGNIHAWSESTPYRNRNFPWPQYRHDIRHSGAAASVVATPLLTMLPVISPTLLSSQTIGGSRSNGVAVAVSVNGQPVATAYPNATTWRAELSGLVEGSNRIRVSTGNFIIPGAVVVDTRAPVVAIIKPAEGLSSSYYQHMMLWSVSDSSETVSKAFLDSVELTATSGDYMPDLSNGTHLLRVEVTDILGHTSVVEREFAIDTSVPVVTLQSPENGKTYQALPQLLYSFNKTSIPTVQVILDGISIPQRTGVFLPVLSNGSHQLEVIATDDVGQSGNISITFTVNIAPPVAVTGEISLITASTATLNGTVNGNSAETSISFEYGLSTAYGTNITATPASIPGTTPVAVTASLTGLTAGTIYHYRIKATNSAGTGYGTDQSFVTWLAPVFTSAAATTFTYNTAGSFTVGASGIPAPLFTTNSTLPNGVTLNSNGTLSGTPTAGGNYPLTITASSSAGSTNQNFMLTVNKATATVNLGSLSWNYNGTPHSATATTIPVGKTVIFTYNGSSIAPTDAGSYNVIGTINDSNYQGTANGTLVINGQGKPGISTLTATARSNYLIADTVITATDNVTPTGYCVTEQNNSTACTWTVTSSATYTFAIAGAKQLYAFAKDAAGNISDPYGPVAVTVSIPTLTVHNSVETGTLTSGIGGSITSTPAGITCNNNIKGTIKDCPGSFSGTVTLYATPSILSTFAGWTLTGTGTLTGCSGLGTCNVTMDGAKSVTATFRQATLLHSGGTSYPTLQEAYNSAGDGTVIEMAQSNDAGTLTADKNISVKLLGGYDAATYNSVTGMTTISTAGAKPLIIKSGKVVLDRIIVK